MHWNILKALFMWSIILPGALFMWSIILPRAFFFTEHLKSISFGAL